MATSSKIQEAKSMDLRALVSREKGGAFHSPRDVAGDVDGAPVRVDLLLLQTWIFFTKERGRKRR